MKYRDLFIISGLIISGLFISMNSAAQDDTGKTEIIRLDNSIFENPQRPGAVFDHDIHNEMAGLEDDCSICHHVYEGKTLVKGESSEDSLCSDCHSLTAGPENSVPLRQAFHDRCKGCHFAQKKGPVLCGECHIKQGR